MPMHQIIRSSNCFKVKDRKKFEKLCLDWGMEAVSDPEREDWIGFRGVCADADSDLRRSRERQNEVGQTLAQELSGHLDETFVAVIHEDWFEGDVLTWSLGRMVNPKGDQMEFPPDWTWDRTIQRAGDLRRSLVGHREHSQDEPEPADRVER